MNAEEFLESGEENLIKERYNASVSDFFKAIVIFCDYLIYREFKIKPKNHNDRFNLLNSYFSDIYREVSDLFRTYTESYNLRMNKEDAEKVRIYAHEIRNFVKSKEGFKRIIK